MHIRTATAADVRAMARVQVETKRAVYLDFYPPELLMQLTVEKTAAAWRHNLFENPIYPGAFALVACAAGGEVVGVLIGGPKTGQRLAGSAEIYVLYVLPAHARQGIGRALVQSAAGRLRVAGYHRLRIWVLAANPARAFYQALGGQATAHKTVDLNGYRLSEIAYDWEDLAQLARVEEVEQRDGDQPHS